MARLRGWSRSAALRSVGRFAVAVVGVGLLATGAVAVFATENSAGATALIAAGTVLIAVAMFADRLESFEGGGVKVQLKAVEDKLRQADAADAAGDPDAAARLRHDAQVLLGVVAPVASRYEQVRETLPYGRQRTEMMGEVVRQARRMARLPSVTSADVAELFDSGEDGNRITALGMMRERGDLISLPRVLAVVKRPRSSFEQYHALRIAEHLVAEGATDADRAAIVDAIATARASGTLAGGQDRSRDTVAARILARLDEG